TSTESDPPPPPLHTPSVIAVGADPGSDPRVRVYDAATGALKYNFLAFDSAFRGGVRVAVGDLNGDGTDDIVCAAGPGGGPAVKVISGADLHLITQYYAYDPTYTGGVYVAAGDITATGQADVITGAGNYGASLVRVYRGTDGRKEFDFRAGDDPRS